MWGPELSPPLENMQNMISPPETFPQPISKCSPPPQDFKIGPPPDAWGGGDTMGIGIFLTKLSFSSVCYRTSFPLSNKPSYFIFGSAIQKLWSMAQGYNALGWDSYMTWWIFGTQK